MLFKISVLKYFAILTGKHLCWSLFLIKLQAFKPATLLKRDPNTSVFLRILRNCEKSAFYRTSLVTAFHSYGTALDPLFSVDKQYYENL